MNYFLWLLWMAADTFIYFWAIAVVFAVGGLVGVRVWLVRQPRPTLRPSFFLGTLAFPCAILAYGTLFHALGPEWRARPMSWTAPYVIYGLLLAQLAVSIALVAQTAVGARVLLGTVLGATLVFSLVCGFISFMSVSGNWL